MENIQGTVFSLKLILIGKCIIQLDYLRCVLFNFIKNRFYFAHGVFYYRTLKYNRKDIMIITPKSEYIKLSKGSQKKVKLQCDSCSKITETAFNNYNNSQKRRGYDGKTYCVSCNCKKLGKNKKGKKSWNSGKKIPHISGNKSKSWKGGRYISSDGYWMVYCGNNDTNIKWKNYRKEHLVIAEQKLKRKLKKGEIVHHLDGDKLNNNPENLEILSSEKEHRILHNQLEQISRDLYKSGYIKYQNGEYFPIESLQKMIEKEI